MTSPTAIPAPATALHPRNQSSQPPDSNAPTCRLPVLPVTPTINGMPEDRRDLRDIDIFVLQLRRHIMPEAVERCTFSYDPALFPVPAKPF